jgi:hypothetical protein
VVVRGGRSDLADLRVAVINAFDDPRVSRYELTVFLGGEGETAAHVAERNLILRRYTKMRQSTLDALRAAGFEPVNCDANGHCQIVFESEPTDEQLLRFAAVFEDVEPNPAYKGKKR